ncbi:NAD(P)/FAD-dependent oxidoreductase [Phytoactinopolyspora limicola]|uniref:NAD(P)/FAD-dependent oxidoreductase n=1 Tax=Phytoactinopolyspora limicola TaxID=2715536 RepID=UPI001A9CB14A|nr:NAD(P)/FAD-dependent oxidoreductase [Phytoactinopolyspora limicola]
MDSRYDVAVVGAGAAGVTAGIVLSRARFDVVVVDAGQPRNAPAAHMHGFPAQDGTSPSAFLATAKAELEHYGGLITSTQVVDAAHEAESGRFRLDLESGDVVRARAVLIATGLTDELPAIEGVQELWGSSVHHCPHCHGYEVRDQEIVVVGGAVPAMSLHQAALLRRYSGRVTLIENGMPLSVDDRARMAAIGVRVIDGRVARLRIKEDRLAGVELGDGGFHACEAVFLAPKPRPNDHLLRALGCATDPESGWTTTGPGGATSVPGVWAAGNATNPRAQVVTAAGEASAAAIGITSWLVEADIEAALAVQTADTGVGAEG